VNIVAIHDLKEDREPLTKALAADLGVTMYEAGARLRQPGSGPVTVAVFAEEAPATALCEKLRTTGFKAAVLTGGEIETEGRASIVRRFGLGADGLDAVTEKGESIRIAYAEIDLILRGTVIVRGTTTETTKNRSVSLGSAVLSGGMKITKTTKTVREVTTEERQGFFNLYAADRFPLVFRENALMYDSLGPALKPFRAANFTYLIAELRRRCPDALYDERLLNRTAQAGLLGPSLNPEEHLIVATALLQKVLRKKSS
jgi:hypothetical protein